MPFGVINGPSTFPRAIAIALQGCETFTATFIDDITIFSSTFQEHHHHLQIVFDKLVKAGFCINPEKCSLAQQEVELIGCMVSKDGVKIMPKNVEKLLAMPEPTCKKDVEHTIATMNICHKHLQNSAEVAAPITDLLGKKRPFKWTPKCAEAFRDLKELISNAPPLANPNPDLPYTSYIQIHLMKGWVPP
jgi:hypothetical protein